jgi:hypothetical protein
MTETPKTRKPKTEPIAPVLIRRVTLASPYEQGVRLRFEAWMKVSGSRTNYLVTINGSGSKVGFYDLATALKNLSARVEEFKSVSWRTINEGQVQ